MDSHVESRTQFSDVTEFPAVFQVTFMYSQVKATNLDVRVRLTLPWHISDGTARACRFSCNPIMHLYTIEVNQASESGISIQSPWRLESCFEFLQHQREEI